MWKLARIMEDIFDFNSDVKLFSKDEIIYIKEGLSRFDTFEWEVVNHKYRNGFIFYKGSIEILGDAFE